MVKTLREKKYHQTCHASACEHMEHLVNEKGGFPSGVAGGAQDFDQVQLIHHEIAEKLKEEGEESPPTKILKSNRLRLAAASAEYLKNI